MKLTDRQIERLRDLEKLDGRLTADVVVADARHRSSPLHDLFEWNLAKAASLHWIQQAREIIGAVEIVINTTTTTLKCPAYVRDPRAEGQGYQHVTKLREDGQSARDALAYTLEVAAGHLRRASDLAAGLGLSAEIDGLLDKIAGVQRRFEIAS